jgi:hypothetical protein
MVVKPGAPAGQENVIRISKEKLADYKAKGYVEAESFVPEQAKNPYAIGMAAAMKATGDTPPLKKSTIVKAHDIAKKVKEEELTAGQKKLPPALQKAIEKKQKNEAVNEGVYEGNLPVMTGSDLLGYNVKYKANKDDKMISVFHSKDKSLAQKFLNDIKLKSGTKNEDISKKEIDKFHTSLDKLVHKSLGPSSDEKKKEVKKEEIEITETEGGSGGGIDALRAIKGKRLRLQQELERLNKDDPNYKEKAANLKKQIETQKEIMARKQREVYGSYDPSKEDALDLNEITDEEEKNYARQITSLSNDKVMARVNKKGDAAIASIQAKIDSVRAERDKKRAQKNEAVDPERIANLQQRIQKMTANMSKIDMAKPENKTKQAIIKSDLQTAQLRLKDLIQKKTSELGKEMKETKNGYKSFKQSLKKRTR